MLHRKNIKNLNKLVAGLILGAMVIAAPVNAKPKSSQANSKSAKKVEPNKDLSKEDQKFVELREAAKANDASKANQLASQLGQHDLADYVSYFQIKPQLYDKGNQARAETGADAAVDAFLKAHAGTAIADRLRNDWLLVLGKRQDWTSFDREYAQFQLDDDAQVKCYALQSRLQKGEDVKTLGAEAKNILLDPQYYGEACPDLVQSLYKAGGLSKSEAQAIGRIALENNFESLSKKTGGDDPIADIVKKARTDPSQAMRDFDKRAWRTGRENTAAAWGVIGQFLAKKLDRDAIKAYRLQHEAGFHQLLSPESQEWKVRTALREGDWKLVKEAIENMSPAVKKRDPAWTFWYGRAQKELGDESLSKETMQALMNQFHFYGQLAREELGMKIYVPKKVHPEESLVKQMGSQKAFARAVRFYDMGLRFEGNREWNWALRGLSDQQLIAVAEHAKRIGLYDRAVNTADRTKSEHDFSLRYPTPYKDALSPIAQSIGLDTNWAYGLIRQESRFIMNARSHVGASGLMQVMPATAKYVAKKIGMNDFKTSQLSDMNTNLKLGSNYLNMVLQDLDGSWALASAAYNAGPGRPKLWREKLPRTVEGAIFAETIPFNETRGYVKNVLANANYYSALSSSKTPSLKQRLGTVSPKASVLSELP
ncbi:MAG: lytic transglycosylase domain-containing protein [Polynucleobacter sp.]|nr:MAG: lytic transglycosylase domain-containing protein [Polynucleobacter sp.]